jgi:hypothetical protein
MSKEARSGPRIRDVYREMLMTFRSRPGLLLAAAFAVFIPLGLLDALDSALESVDTDEIGDVGTAAIAGEVVLHSVIVLLGDVFFAGVVATAVTELHGEEHRPLRRLARSLPWGRLIAIDILFALLIAVGFLLLIVPALVFATWFALAAPAAKLEGRSVRDSFRRSRALVQGRFWIVFWTVIPLTIVGYALATIGETAGYGLLGETFIGDWVGAVVGDVIVSGPYALAVVVLFFELRDSRPAEVEGQSRSERSRSASFS